MQDDGAAEFPDQTGHMDGTCQLMQQSFTPRKAVYELYRTEAAQQRHIATITLEQFPRPTAIGGHKVRGHIAVSHPLTPSSTAEALSLAGVLDTAGQIALGLGVIRLVYDDTPPVADDDAARLRDELAQTQAYYQTLQESYDGYVQTLEQSLREWENALSPGRRRKNGPFPCPTALHVAPGKGPGRLPRLSGRRQRPVA